MKKNACILFLFCGALVAAGLYSLFPPVVRGAAQAKGATVISDEIFHLGNDEKKDWKAFTRAKPHDGKKITVRFSAEPNKSERALELKSGEVNSKCLLKSSAEAILPCQMLSGRRAGPSSRVKGLPTSEPRMMRRLPKNAACRQNSVRLRLESQRLVFSR